jgi:rfaE bifunctional protein nucleotidyltransferase chain/domain
MPGRPPTDPPFQTPSLNLAGDGPDPARPIAPSNAVAPAVPASSKILSHNQLLADRTRARAGNRTVVQCHGCFDIVHPGHIRHLRQAKSQGEILLVSITGDAEMKKGTGRPLIPEELRAENLAALDCVDWVYIDQRETAADLLEEVRPDVYIKGAEYEFNSDPRFRAERDTVERHGGRVVFSSGDVVFSSTALIAALEHSIDPYHARLRQLLATPELEGPRLAHLISAFRGKRVVVVGEPIIDTYVLCDRPHVAGESPIMTLRPVERRAYDGGAAVIARHLAALGALPVLVTAMPRDENAAALRQRLLVEGVEVRSIPLHTRLPEKQRFLVGGQKVMKLDLLEPMVLDAAQQDAIVALATEAAAEHGGADAAIIADFGQGLLSPGVLGRLCVSLRRHARILSGDVSGRRANLTRMFHMDLLCPTESELRDALNMFDESLPAVAWRLLKETRSKAAMVTLGPEGLIGFDPIPDEGAPAPAEQWRTRVRSEHVPALCAHAIDPLGCGDALLATATLALASGGSLLAASFLGSLAAACEAQRLGNIVISSADLRHGIARIHASHLAYVPSEVIQARPVAPARTPFQEARAV